MESDRLYSTGQICFMLGGISKEKLFSLEKRGYLNPQRAGRRGDRLYSQDDLERAKQVIEEERR